MPEALETCKLNSEIHPDIWNVWYNLANLQQSMEMKKEALENYRRVLEIDPNNFNGTQIRQTLSEGAKP
jgi:tetratricopeptide (TPR) repeat protein